MAYILTSDQKNWSDWVSGESARAVWFYRMLGDYGYKVAHNPRWRQLASTLTQPNYRTNFDHQKAKAIQGAGKKQELVTKFFEETGNFNEKVSSIMSRAASREGRVRRARGTRPKGQELGDEELASKNHSVRNSQSMQHLPRLGRSTQRADPTDEAKTMVEQLKAERKQRRVLEQRLKSLEQQRREA